MGEDQLFGLALLHQLEVAWGIISALLVANVANFGRAEQDARGEGGSEGDHPQRDKKGGNEKKIEWEGISHEDRNGDRFAFNL